MVCVRVVSVGGVKWCGLVRCVVYGVVKRGVAWCHVRVGGGGGSGVWCVWCSVLWCGVMWCGVACCVLSGVW